MTSVNPSLCMSCSRVTLKALPRVGGGLKLPSTCTAYPTGIPRDILAGADHRQLRGDEVKPLTFDRDPTHDQTFGSWESMHRLASS